MSQQPSAPANPSVWNRAVIWILPAYLVGNFLIRTLTAAHEYPMRTEQVLEMSIDAPCIVGLFGVRKRMQPWIFRIALIAGLCLFAIRATSDASWWTGHLMYSLLPR